MHINFIVANEVSNSCQLCCIGQIYCKFIVETGWTNTELILKMTCIIKVNIINHINSLNEGPNFVKTPTRRESFFDCLNWALSTSQGTNNKALKQRKGLKGCSWWHWGIRCLVRWLVLSNEKARIVGAKSEIREGTSKGSFQNSTFGLLFRWFSY